MDACNLFMRVETVMSAVSRDAKVNNFRATRSDVALPHSNKNTDGQAQEYLFPGNVSIYKNIKLAH